MFKTFADMMQQLHKEDTTFYCKLIAKINTEKMENRQASTYLQKLTSDDLKLLTTTQLKLLDTMRFKGGYTLSFYPGYKMPNSPIYEAIDKLNVQVSFNRWSFDMTDVTKEDLKFLPTYMITQWKKLNPTTTKRNVKGVKFTPSMDMFSLEVFRNSITKPFLRTEAKNLVLQVNSAFNNSSRGDDAIKVRNKFYGIILDNTPVQTKALINSLMPTNLNHNNIPYQLDSGEAVRYDIPWQGDSKASYMTRSSLDTWSSDLAIVTHNNGIGDERSFERHISAASAFMTFYVETNNIAYKELADRMASIVPPSISQEVLAKTSAIVELRNTLNQIKDHTNE